MDSCIECGTAFGPSDSECPQCGASRPGLEPTVTRASPLLDGKWAIEKELGHGGMGTVFLANEVALDRKVAIKMLSPSLKQEPEVITRFEREAKMLARLEHPNLVPIYAVGRSDGLPFIVMKNLEGATLSGYLRDRVRLSVPEMVAISRQLCAGLGFIHSKGIIHRDIKPGNIFVGPDGHVTILDLGVAHDSNQQLTKTGLLIGTPRYMSPEQILYGSGKIDYRSDLYALATVMFEMLTGAPVFEAESDFSVMRAHTDEVPPDASTLAPDVPPAVAAVLHQALAKSPSDRYQSAQELCAALEAAAAGVSSPQVAASPGIGTRLERRPGTPRPPTGASQVAAGRPKTPHATNATAQQAGRPRTPHVTNATGQLAGRPRGPATQPGVAAAGPTVPMKALTRPGQEELSRPADTDPLNAMTDPSAPAHGGVSDTRMMAAAGIKRGPSAGVLIGGVVAVLAVAGAVAFVALGSGSDDPQPAPAHTLTQTETPSPVTIPPREVGTPTPPEVVAAPPEAPTPPAVPTEMPAPDQAGEAVAATAKTTERPEIKSTSRNRRAKDSRKTRDEGATSAASAPAPTEVRVVATHNGGPSWAWLDVNGIRRGTTPAILKLEPGTYKLRLSRPGYKTVDKTVEVESGQPLRLSMELKQ